MKKIILSAAMLGALSLSANTASAEALALSNFNANYGTTVTSCALCHTTSTGSGGTRNVFGDNFKTAGGTKAAYAPNFNTLSLMDADGDTVDNGTEITNGTAPGGNGTLAAPTDIVTTTTTTSDGGGGGCIASSATTPLMMVLAILSLGFFVRRKKS